MSEKSPSAPSALAKASWAVAALSLLLQVVYFWGVRVDDAYITFRIGRNLLETGAPVFNLGEKVEAYSNPLWMLLTAPAALLGDPMALVAPLGLCFLVLNSWVVTRIAGRLCPSSSVAPPLALLLTSCAPGWVYWHLSGLESPLVVCLLLLGIWQSLTRSVSRWMPVIWVLLVCTRVDGFVLATLGAGLPLLLQSKEGLRSTIRNGTAVALALGAITVFRLVYFGHPMPNTYYAKLTEGVPQLGAGAAYLWQSWGALPLLVAGWLGGAWLAHRERHSRLGTFGGWLFVVGAALAAIAVRAQGDWMPLGRLLLPAVPLAAVGAVLLATQWVKNDVILLASTTAQALLAASAFFLGEAHLAVLQTTELVMIEQRLGAELKAYLPEGATIATGAIGAAPFVSSLNTIDMGGLGDPHIARAPVSKSARSHLSAGHLRGDGSYVLDREPKILIFSGGRSDRPVSYTSDVQIAFDPRFWAFYKLKEFSQERAGESAGRLPFRHARAGDLEAYAALTFEKKAAHYRLKREKLHLAVFERTAPDSPRRKYLAKVAELEKTPDAALRFLTQGAIEAGLTPGEIQVLRLRQELKLGRLNRAFRILRSTGPLLPPHQALLLKDAQFIDPLFEELTQMMADMEDEK